MLKPLFLCTLLLASALTLADGIDLGQPLPSISIDDRGELLLQDDDFSYTPWVLAGDVGKIHILQYMAATKGASEINKPFTDRLKEIPNPNYLVTTVINLDDAMWGTSGFVIGEVKKNKRMFPGSTMVLDAEGVGRETWKLQAKSSAIVVMDAQGAVHYVKDGAMSESEIEQTLEFILAHMAPAAS